MHAPRSQLLEALLEVLPPARHAHREDVPKGGRIDTHGPGAPENEHLFFLRRDSFQGNLVFQAEF